ncbi:MAG: XdhC family protein [Ruminococcus sp.]|nr:XdhC family protein [Ruminococcus sp.]
MRSSIFAEIAEQLNRGESPELTITVNGQEYIRRFEKSDRLILLGCGHVSLDVYNFAMMLGFSVVAVDDRPSFANRERFPQAEIICDSFLSAIEKLTITERDYVCVLTRGHRWDKECVEAILSGTMPYYLGMIGSRRRVAGLKVSLEEQGFDPQRIGQLHAPIGVDIGAMTTAEIALSICAQLIQVKRRVRYVPKENELLQTNVDEKLLRYLSDPKEPCVCITVLNSTGSTPVKSGSMMAVNRLGQTVGTIGGGCSEAAAIAKARRIIGTGTKESIVIDMSNEVAADNGMVCGGEMTVLIEDVVSE